MASTRPTRALPQRQRRPLEPLVQKSQRRLRRPRLLTLRHRHHRQRRQRRRRLPLLPRAFLAPTHAHRRDRNALPCRHGGEPLKVVSDVGDCEQQSL